MRFLYSVVVASALLAGPSLSAEPSCGQQFCIGWSKIAGGGTLESQSVSGSWKLGGTIGQWEATSAQQLAGGTWMLTGGFWAVLLEDPTDGIFHDSFQFILEDPLTGSNRQAPNQ